MANLIVRTADDQEEEVVSPEQAELLIRLARQATQEVSSYVERIRDCPVLFGTERN